MRLRDKKCRADGCTVPVTWTEAHHLKPWSEGGHTTVGDGILLCGHHHRRAHDSRYDMTKLPTGDYRFHLRT
ncbi:HNH endonuclease signature motif containing protein [Nocardioides maradonensis]